MIRLLLVQLGGLVVQLLPCLRTGFSPSDGQTKQKYLDLKRKKILLEQSGEYEDIKRTEIAGSLGKLLSYPDDKINELINNNLNK